MEKNFLKRFIREEINALMTASAFNLGAWLRIVNPKCSPFFILDHQNERFVYINLFFVLDSTNNL